MSGSEGDSEAGFASSGVSKDVTPGSVKQMLRRIEENDDRGHQRSKRSRESPASSDEGVLVSKFDEVIALIKRENIRHREAMVSEMQKEFAALSK